MLIPPTVSRSVILRKNRSVPEVVLLSRVPVRLADEEEKPASAGIGARESEGSSTESSRDSMGPPSSHGTDYRHKVDDPDLYDVPEDRHLLDDRILDDTPEHFHMHEALDDELAASGTKSKDSMPIMYEASNEELRASRMKWKESTPLLYEVSDDGQPAGGMDWIPGASTWEDSHKPWYAEHTTVTAEEFLLQSCWMNWENELRQAHQHGVLAQSCLAWRLPPHPVWTRPITAEEEGRFQVWKAGYINQPARFEDERMEAGAFGLGE